MKKLGTDSIIADGIARKFDGVNDHVSFDEQTVDKIWNMTEIQTDDRVNWLIMSCRQTEEVAIENDDDGYYSINLDTLEQLDNFIDQLIKIKENIYNNK